MSLPRFRLRTLMVAVAISGLAFGGEVIRQRRKLFQAKSSYHASQVVKARKNLADELAYEIEFQRPQRAFYCSGRMPEVALARRLVAWHELLRLKYKRAARYPLLPVPPDPPEPE